jgi:putative ABC transport system permease protein
MRAFALLEIFVLGLSNLRRNKLRSFLTMLGMIFGVGSVIAMLSVGAGARHAILERIGQLGIQNIIVNSVKPPQEKKSQGNEENWVDRYGLTFDDEAAIREVCPTVERVFPVNLLRKPVWHGSSRVDAAVLGVLPEHLEMFRLRVGRGRPLNDIDERTDAKVCVVRKGLTRELSAMRDPLGMSLKVGGYSFEVVGVLEDEQFESHTRKALALDDRAHEVYVPYSTSMRTFGTATFVQRAGSEERSVVELDQLVVMAASPDLVYTTAKIIAAILARGHERKDYEIVIPLELLEQSERTQAVFNVVMVLIAAISLVVGGIGIANIMLATITERTREIGVRRALGATRSDITAQFLTETAAIGLIGGVLGCAFGFGVIQALVHFTGWRAIVEPQYFAISLLISAGVAVASGIYPARRAALLDPITSLRYE